MEEKKKNNLKQFPRLMHLSHAIFQRLLSRRLQFLFLEIGAKIIDFRKASISGRNLFVSRLYKRNAKKCPRYLYMKKILVVFI